MEKVKFETKQCYIDYCKEHEIMNISRKYASQYADIDCGLHHDDTRKYIYFHPENGIDYSKYIMDEPLKYPCILAWTCIEGDNDIYRGIFIYPEDFE